MRTLSFNFFKESSCLQMMYKVDAPEEGSSDAMDSSSASRLRQCLLEEDNLLFLLCSEEEEEECRLSCGNAIVSPCSRLKS